MIVDINDKNISDYSKEELQNWIEYFENYQAQNILASGVIINGVPINQWKGWMKEVIKILKTYLENREIGLCKSDDEREGTRFTSEILVINGATRRKDSGVRASGARSMRSSSADVGIQLSMVRL